MDAAHHKDTFALVRRHGAELRSRFALHLGYRLLIEPGYARLLKAPLPEGSPPRPPLHTTKNGAVTNPRVFRDICLISAALQAPGVGDQLLISHLSTQVRADAAEAGIAFSETLTDRRDFVTAMNALIDWGVIAETEGTVAAWSADTRQEALLTVDRNRLPNLLSNSVRDHDGPRVPPLKSLARKLVENPVVLRAELSDDEQTVLRQDRAKLEAALEMFGLHLEVRREGALAWGETSEVSDDPFPGEGTLRQAALLFLTEAAAGGKADEDGRLVLTIDQAQSVIAGLLTENSGMWKAAFEPDAPDAARRTLGLVLGYLEGFALTREAEGVIQISPATARYRADVSRSRSRVAENLQTTQTTLFDETGQQ
ncbi:TIGR02678 family protein [Microbacterium hominis]|uniref:TIGR02678 family protein n=1 Tax=Microbacterium hominis TaxID=162426 RepID=A0A7D4Q073_9MICO|nr:TIGR02678 family protein [Microbacterium hominis]